MEKDIAFLGIILSEMLSKVGFDRQDFNRVYRVFRDRVSNKLRHLSRTDNNRSQECHSKIDSFSCSSHSM